MTTDSAGEAGDGEQFWRAPGRGCFQSEDGESDEPGKRRLHESPDQKERRNDQTSQRQ